MLGPDPGGLRDAFRGPPGRPPQEADFVRFSWPFTLGEREGELAMQLGDPGNHEFALVTFRTRPNFDALEHDFREAAFDVRMVSSSDLHGAAALCTFHDRFSLIAVTTRSSLSER